MKKLLLMFAALAATGYASAQTLPAAKVPATVTAAFAQKYPAVQEVKWEKENGNYEAGYTLTGTENSAVLDASGNILETETAIPQAQLPTQAQQYLAKNYAHQKITETAKITAASGKVTYEAEVNGKDVLFDSSGKFMKKSQEEDDED
ncbi:PepSY-like domain-containing protein [Pontibacter chitinilyticus]|uniref:PepSY-like domain-containing protein n=1 Tax=Pontibacter chitinilyticus TaxID=2674989 RepID=UPI00321932ED